MANSDSPVSGNQQTSHARDNTSESKSRDLQETYVNAQPENDDMGATKVSPAKKSASDEAQAATQKLQKTNKSPGKSKKIVELGEFKLIKKLGQGGMGEVFLANQTSLDRNVAVKVLSKEFAKKPGSVDRFLREARSMAKIDHPNAVRIFAAQSDKGMHFVAIEYIDGQSMQDWLNQLGKLSVGDALHVVLMCADALKHAHDMHLIHRDIKPDNILVTKKGIPKVADFGLAKALDDQDLSMTQTGTGLGTPLYMPPEQARNAKTVDHRTDIYALGCTLYYFLTGKLPFTGKTILELISNKEKGKYPSAKSLNSKIPEKLDLMIDKMIATKPAHRYQSCEELIDDLDSLGLAHANLSFIAGGAPSASLKKSAPQAATQAKSAAQPTRSAVPVSSAEDAERTAREKATKVDEDIYWYVKHTNARGKVTISRMSAEQIQQSIRAEILDLKAQCKKSMKGDFLPVSQFAEFQSLMKKRLIKAQSNARADHMKDMYRQIDKEQRNRNRWRFWKGKGEGFIGGIGLILYLAAICAVLYGIYWVFPYVRDWVAEALNLQ